MIVESLSRDEIVQIGDEYHLNISGTFGTTPENLAVFVAYSAAVFLAAFTGVIVFTLVFGIENWIDTWLLTFAAWTATMGMTYKLWLVHNEKFTGLITLNNFTQELHSYGSGFSIKKMWETYKQEDFIDLRGDLITGTQKFMTASGVPVVFDWSQQFAPYLPMLPLYVRMENKVLEDGMEDVVDAVLSHNLLGRKIDDVRKPEVVNQIQQDMRKAMAGEKIGNAVTQDVYENTMEERFGIKMEFPTLSPPKFEKEQEELLMGSHKVKTFTKDAKKLGRATKTWAGIAPEKAMRQVMIMNNEPGVTDTAITLQADDNMRQMGGDLGTILRAGTAISQGVQAVTRGGGKRKGGKP